MAGQFLLQLFVPYLGTHIGALLGALVSVVFALVGLSVLTTIYGVYLQGRRLD